ncbi:MAG: hypothetical protein M1837_004629 [Sclerophora amabilis]|nr:MAG: hypothetical protein M1837_004629 [Sclerophora amabilis]
MEWIKSRENFDEAPDTDSANGSSHQPSGSTGLSATDHKKQWIPVPDDPSMANSSCPICQEKFETLWHDEAQEWVWMDAIKVGGRIYHASCHSEATKDGVGTPVRGLTPDPQVLGKRKAEESDLISSRAKMKKEVE